MLGPEKLPKLAQQVGRWVGRARAMARQFRDQLEEEAHNLETKVNIDPGIDTSLDPKPAAPPAAAPPTYRRAPRLQVGTGRRVLSAGPSHASSQRATARLARPALNPRDGAQAELDLTTPRDDDVAPRAVSDEQRKPRTWPKAR